MTVNDQIRHSQEQVSEWQETGFVIIPNFFSAEEIAPILLDYERLYGTQGESNGLEIDEKEAGSFGEFRAKQFKNIDTLPYDGSPQMNLLSMHPALVTLARSLLGTADVHLYQSHTWAKYTGESDYDQLHHCDFGNHTLTVPADDIVKRTVDIVIYLTDVSDEHGALHYVTKPDSNVALREGAIAAPDPEQQAALKAVERSAAAPAGTIVAHSIDTFHRGTNLTLKNGYRFTMTIGYKAKGNDMISYTAWQQGENRPWNNVFDHASPEQLDCLGIPLPGDAFWTERTLKLTQARWPEWDMSPYFEAADIPRKRARA